MWQRNILVLSMVFLNAVAFAQTHQHGAAATSDGQFNPYVTADPNGGFYLIYIQRTNGKSDVMLRHSPDGGSFSAPKRVNDREGDAMVRNENPPKVAVGHNGEVYVCWGSERGRWKGDIRFARSTDGGKTFSPAVSLNSDAGGEPAGHAFQSMAVDSKGSVYVAWIDERHKKKEDRGGEIWMNISRDGGTTFSGDRKILSDVCECCRTNLQVDPQGRLWLSYRTVPRTGRMYRDIVVARSFDDGKTFTPRLVSQDGWEINGCPVAGPSLSVDDKGNMTVIWFMGDQRKRPGLYYATSTDQGETFSSRKLLDRQQKLGKHVHSTGGADGKIIVAWDDTAVKTFSVSGILDGPQGLVQKGEQRAGVTYPVVAANRQAAVIVGMRASTREIVIYTESLNESAKAGRGKD